MGSVLSLETLKLRDKILNINHDVYQYGVGDFTTLDVNGLKALLNNDFIQLNGCFNSSATVKVFLDFMTKYPMFKCFGFATRRASEYIVCITGIEGHNIKDKDAIMDFSMAFRLADEFCVTQEHCRAWYD